MNEQERNKKLVEDHYAAVWSGDEDLVRQQLSSEFVDHGPQGDMKGIEPAIAFLRGARVSFPDMKIAILNSVAEADRVAVHVKWQGTHKGPFMGVPGTGKAITFEGMVFWRIADGKIVERWAILDAAGIMRQLQN